MENEKVLCDTCEDTGYVTKTSWAGEDESYDVEVKCACGVSEE